MAALRRRRRSRRESGQPGSLQRRAAAEILIAALAFGAWADALAQAPKARATTAAAQDRGLYAGAALGEAKFTKWCDPAAVLLSCDDKSSVWKIYGGYRINRYLAVEGTYIDWGDVSGTVLQAGVPRSITAEQTSMGIAVVGNLALTPRFSLLGKAGFLQTEQEIRRVGPTVTTVEGDDREFHYGFGARYAFTPRLAARLEWERTDELEAKLFSFGVEFKF